MLPPIPSVARSVDPQPPDPDDASQASSQGLSSQHSVGSSSHAKSIDSLRSLKKAQKAVKYDEISEEDRYLAMLGYKMDGVKKNPLLYREDFCGACGVQHPNPSMLDLYPNCISK